MRKFAVTTLLLLLISAGTASRVDAQISVGVRIGPPPAARVVRALPRRPGADFVWVDGYWYPVGRQYKWHAGYWTRPPYAGARWVVPRYDGHQYFGGYWEGASRRVDHDHRSDRDRDRDFDRDGGR